VADKTRKQYIVRIKWLKDKMRNPGLEKELKEAEISDTQIGFRTRQAVLSEGMVIDKNAQSMPSEGTRIDQKFSIQPGRWGSFLRSRTLSGNLVESL
jgi:hypothetical protein